MLSDSENSLRARIDKLLQDGLKTQTEPFPENDRQFAAVLNALHDLDPKDLKAKLVIAGFTNYPYGEDRMRCQECMYYLVHRRWCDLPELALPVKADWWCRLWRI